MESKKKERVNHTNSLPTAEPSLTVPTESLNSTPETVSEVEPKSYQPEYPVE